MEKQLQRGNQILPAVTNGSFRNQVRLRLSRLFRVRLIWSGLMLLAGLILIANANDVAAQDIDVSGTVVSADGEALPGVNVVILGTSSGTVTNIDGTYSLTAPSDGVLLFTYIGFNRVEEAIEGRSTINVTLEESVSELGEVMVTGYSSQRQADITGAVSSVDMDEMNKMISTSVLGKLQGRVAGVNVTSSGSPGSRNTVRIRGVSSFQENDPLYIIDGVPMQDAYNNWLNPNDIESMQVLKDASAASIYGSRANNGVIIITTKQGARGAPQVSLDVTTGMATPVKGYDDFLILDPMDYHEVIRRSHVNAGLSVPTNIYGDPNNPSIPNYIWPNDGTNQTMQVDESTYSYPDNLIMPASQGTNWWDEMFGPALTQDYNLGISGGAENHRYNVSFNYLDQDGTAIHNWYRRGSVRVNTEFNSGIFTIGENVALSLTETVGGLRDIGGFAEGTIVGKNVLMQPIVPVYDINGYYAGGKANTLGNQDNPVAVANKQKDNVTANRRIVGSVFGIASLMDQLDFKSTFGFNLGQGSFKGFAFPTPENSEPTLTQGVNENYNESTSWTWSNTLNYVDTFAERHNIDALVGTEATKNSNVNMGASMRGYITTVEDAWYISDALGDPGTKNVNSSGGFSSLYSFFGKVDYNYASKYYASVTLRRDGSSRLGSTNRWGTFPAFSVGWRLSEENFFQGANALSDLRIRGGYGVTGNQNIPAGRVFNQFGGGTGNSFYDISGSNSSLDPGFRLTSVGNNNLKWEENVSYNVGLDAEFLEGRVTFVVDLYHREVDDLLFNPQTPATQGQAAPPIVNIGKMQNRGIDFSIGYRGNIGDEVNWNVDFNGSHYQNEIVRIDGVQEFFYGPVSGRQSNIVINELGAPIGAFYGLVQDGIFQNEAEVEAHVDQDGAAPGRFRFRDVNGDGQISGADRAIIGDPHPDFTGGLNLGFQWKNFDLSTFIFGSFGNDIFQVQKEFTVFRLFSTNVRKDLLTDSWTPNNPDAKYPQLDQNDEFSSQVSSFYVDDGSYVRLQNLQIGYNVPATTINRLGLQSLRVYLQGQNLFTITGYDNIDPALPASTVSGSGGNVSDQTQGIDRGTYPTSRIISLGLNVRF